MIFGLLLFNPHRFGNTFKQINYRRSVDAKGIFIDHKIRFGIPVQVYPDIKSIIEIRMFNFIQAVKIKEKELFRETKIFKKEEVARERSSRIGNQMFIRVKSNGLYVIFG